MLRGRADEYADRIREALHDAFTEDHTPREVAGSFAIGTFITMMPTWGTGVLLFFVIVYITDRVSKIALFASVVVFNPVVKWGVYAASFALGVFLLGPVPGVSLTDVSPSAGPEIVIRLLVGNLILAIIATVLAYVIVYRLVVRFRESPVGETIDKALEEIGDEIVERNKNDSDST